MVAITRQYVTITTTAINVAVYNLHAPPLASASQNNICHEIMIINEIISILEDFRSSSYLILMEL